MVDQLVEYRYRRPSEVLGGERPVLVAPRGRAFDGGTSDTERAVALDEPQLFSGFVEHAHVAAAGLLAVAKVAGTRYYTPGSMIAATIKAADPVVTSDGERLRFESLSPCSGVYSRLDLLPDGLDATRHGVGTTNVDLNAPARRALGDVMSGEPLGLEVGEDEVRLQTLDADVVERRVPLPERWIRSFAELHVGCRSLEPLLEMSASEARRLVAGFPTASERTVVWLAQAGRVVRRVHGRTDGAVQVPGPERLGALAPLFRHGVRVRVFGPTDGDPSSSTAWVLDLRGARLTFVLSPDVTRGFSGEGGLLGSLAEDDPHATDEVAYGSVGFDLAENVSFARQLPFPVRSLEAMQPRLATARRLVEAGAVTGSAHRWEVVSRDATHVVSIGDAQERCSCTWSARHHGDRGPCSHVLAVRIVTSGSS